MTRFLVPLFLTAPLALAAPLPFPRPATAVYLPVELRGPVPDPSLAARVPNVVTNKADYEDLARICGLRDAPPVNFRTHFLYVGLCHSSETGEPEVDAAGDLAARASAEAARLKCVKLYPGPRYLIRSYPRAAVKTVNGVPLAK